MRLHRPCTRSHYLSPIKGRDLPDRFTYIDIGTKLCGTSKTVRRLTLSSAVICETWYGPEGERKRESWQSVGDGPSVSTAIQATTRTGETSYTIASSASRVAWTSDLYRGMSRLGWTCDFFFEKALTYILRARKGRRVWCLLGLQNFLRFNIQELSMFIGPEQESHDGSVNDAQELLAHLTSNVLIIQRAFERYLKFCRDHDTGPFRQTLASAAFTAWRYRFLKDKILVDSDRTIVKLATKALCPPKVDVRYRGTLRKGPFVKLDVNGLYPHVMKSSTYPGQLAYLAGPKSPSEASSLLRDFRLIAECEVCSPNAIFPVRTGREVSWPTGTFGCVLASESLAYAIEKNLLRSVRRALVYLPCRPFREFVDYFAALKEQATKDHDIVTRTLCKDVLARFWGKFASRNPAIVHVEDCDPEEIRRELGFILETGERTCETSLMGKCWMERGAVPNSNYLPQIAAHVADYGRIYLQRIMDTVGPDFVLYHDADSIIIPERFLDRLAGRLHPFKTGWMRVDAKGPTLTIAAPKDYEIGDKVVIAGLKLEAKACGDRMWSFSEFPGFASLANQVEPGTYPVRQVFKQFSSPSDSTESGDQAAECPF